MGYSSITNNCCSYDSGNAVIANLGSKYKTIVVDLNSANLQIPMFYIYETSSGNQWTYGISNNGQPVGSFSLEKEISSIVKAGFNGVMYSGSNIIDGFGINFTDVININELNVSSNKILYIEVEI